MQRTLVSFAVTLIILGAARASTHGVVKLDTLTFDKVISKFDAVLVKFNEDEADVDHLTKVAEALEGNPHALVAEVMLEVTPQAQPSQYDYYDYPEPAEPTETNTELAKRYNIEREDWPVHYLFLKGKEPIRYPGDPGFYAETYLKWLKEHGVYVGLNGCLEEMDTIAKEFIKDKEARAKLVEDAKTQAEKYTDDVEKENAKIYVTYMQKIMDKGDDLVKKEQERLKRLLEGEMSDAKRAEVTKRSNVIASFALPSDKDEL